MSGPKFSQMFVFYGLLGLLVGCCGIPATSLYDPPGPHQGDEGFFPSLLRPGKRNIRRIILEGLKAGVSTQV